MYIYINIERKGTTPSKGVLVIDLEGSPNLEKYLKSKGVTPKSACVYNMDLGKKEYKDTYILQDIYKACSITDEKRIDLSSDIPIDAVFELKALNNSLNSGWTKKNVANAIQDITNQDYVHDYEYVIENTLKRKVKEVLEYNPQLSKRSVENLVSSKFRKYFGLKKRKDIVGKWLAHAASYIDNIDTISIASKAKKIS